MATDYLGGLNTYVGDIGRRRSRGRQQQRSALANAAYNRSNRVASMVRPDIAGSPSRDAAMLPAGFPAFSFALATGTNIVTQQTNVQCPFRGQRLVCQVIRTGTSAASTAPLIQVFTVGMRPILATGVAVPLEIFAQNAFDTNILLPPTVPGVIYTLGISLSNALTTTDTILCVVGILGSAIL